MYSGCGKPKTFTNGIYVDDLVEHYAEDQHLSFSCNSGYISSPENSRIVCGADEWNNLPNCIPGKIYC